MGGYNLGNILPINVPNCHRGKFMFFDLEKKLEANEFYFLEPGLWVSIKEIVEAMNTLIQETHNHCESCITVIVCRRTQKVQIYLANAGSVLVFVSMDLGLIFSRNVRDEFGLMLKQK